MYLAQAVWVPARVHSRWLFIYDGLRRGRYARKMRELIVAVAEVPAPEEMDVRLPRDQIRSRLYGVGVRYFGALGSPSDRSF